MVDYRWCRHFLMVGVYSRLYAYLTGPLIVPLKMLSDILFVFLAIALSLLDLALFPITYPLRRRAIRNRLEQDKKEWIEKNVTRDPATNRPVEDPEAAYAREVAQIKEKYGHTMLETLAADKVTIQTDNFSRLVQYVGDKFLAPVHFARRLGTACRLPLSRKARA